jgi:hypothetical protein
VKFLDADAVGASGNYRGLVLAVASDGFSGPDMAFDSDSGSKLSDKAVLENFRSGTTPNTYGEFRDDGEYVGRLLQQADAVISLLFVGTELSGSIQIRGIRRPMPGCAADCP